MLKESVNETDLPCLERQRKAPKRLDNGSTGHHFSNPKAFYRQQYFEVLDLLHQEICSRFEQKGFSLLKDIEEVLLKAANADKVTIPQSISETYANDLDMERLVLQLKMLADLIKSSEMNASFPLKEITKLETLCTIMAENASNRKLFSEIDKLLRLYLTVPGTSATAERTFSVL